MIGKINFIIRFISNLSERILPFSPLLKLRVDHDFKWDDEKQKTFDSIKNYLKMLVLMPLDPGKSFKLYLSTGEQSIRSALIQKVGERKSHILFKQKIGC